MLEDQAYCYIITGHLMKLSNQDKQTTQAQLLNAAKETGLSVGLAAARWTNLTKDESLKQSERKLLLAPAKTFIKQLQAASSNSKRNEPETMKLLCRLYWIVIQVFIDANDYRK